MLELAVCKFSVICHEIFFSELREAQIRSVTNGGYSLHRTWRTPQNLEITSFSKKRCKGQNLGITWRTPTWGSPQTWGSILKLGITTFPQKRCNGLNLGITFKTWGSPPLGFQSRASNMSTIEGLSGAFSAQGWTQGWMAKFQTWGSPKRRAG